MNNIKDEIQNKYIGYNANNEISYNPLDVMDAFERYYYKFMQLKNPTMYSLECASKEPLGKEIAPWVKTGTASGILNYFKKSTDNTGIDLMIKICNNENIQLDMENITGDTLLQMHNLNELRD